MQMTKSEKKEQEKTSSKDRNETQKKEEKVTPIKTRVAKAKVTII